MRRFILTGAPGAGKTTLIRALTARGHTVVEEAATDINAQMLARGIGQPHLEPGFIDDIVDLQRRRRLEAAQGALQFHDRSPICTYALCRFLDRPVPAALARELEEIEQGGVYQRCVLFIENLGFMTPTPVRRISFADSLRFEAAHEEAYSEFGYDLLRIARGSLGERVESVERAACSHP